MLFEMRLNISELGQKLVVFQDFEVLHVEVGLVVSLELLAGLSRVNAFDDAESAEVLQADLQVADSIAARFVLGGLTLGAFLDQFSHIVCLF